MKIFGHPLIPSMPFKKVSTLQEIDTTLANTMIYFDAQEDKDCNIASFCKANQIPYAVFIHSITDLLIYANLQANYLIANQNFSIFQKIIKEYLLDCLLLCMIKEENEMEELALLGVDGVIFKNAF